MVCPHCKTPISGSADFCIFCGTPFTRAGRRAAHYCASSLVKTPGIVRAKRVFYGAALLLSVSIFCSVLLTPRFGGNTPPLVAEVTPQSTASPEPVLPSAAPTPTPLPTTAPSISPAPSPTEPQLESGAFSDRSGSYPVRMYISEVESANPDTQASGEAMLNKQFDGTLTLEIDSLGDGTIQIDQGFFSPEAVLVSAFVDSANVTSGNTLYGVSQETGYVLTVVCVCAEGGVSGLIWMDNVETHIEFIYFG